MLFYLLSRGLDRDTALRLLKWAFLEDVVSKIEVPELRRQIEASLAGQLSESAALNGVLASAQDPLVATAGADGRQTRGGDNQTAALTGATPEQPGTPRAANGQTADGASRADGERTPGPSKENR